jgi:hypothetical protein
MLSVKGLIEAAREFNFQIEAVARELGVVFVDNASVVPRNIDCFGVNVHYTSKGARLVAERFKNQLINQ